MANKSRPRQVMCRLNDEEYSRYKELLNESGMKSQDFVKKAITTKRFTVVKKTSKSAESNELSQMLFHLSKVGTNLNQIAKKLNERQGYVDYGGINKTAKEVSNLISEIREAISKE